MLNFCCLVTVDKALATQKGGFSVIDIGKNDKFSKTFCSHVQLFVTFSVLIVLDISRSLTGKIYPNNVLK